MNANSIINKVEENEERSAHLYGMDSNTYNKFSSAPGSESDLSYTVFSCSLFERIQQLNSNSLPFLDSNKYSCLISTREKLAKFAYDDIENSSSSKTQFLT